MGLMPKFHSCLRLCWPTTQSQVREEGHLEEGHIVSRLACKQFTSRSGNNQHVSQWQCSFNLHCTCFPTIIRRSFGLFGFDSKASLTIYNCQNTSREHRKIAQMRRPTIFREKPPSAHYLKIVAPAAGCTLFPPNQPL